MAGRGRKVWTGETLSVPDLQDYLQDQVVMQFDSIAARDAAITAPTDGMHVYIRSLGVTLVRVGSAWRPVGFQPRANLYATAQQTGLATGYATINMGAATVDDVAGLSGGGFVCPAAWAGRWLVSGAVANGGLTANGTLIGGRFLVNSQAQVAAPPTLLNAGGTGGNVTPLVPAELNLVANDLVALQGYVNQANWSTLGAGSAGASTSILRLQRIAA